MVAVRNESAMDKWVHDRYYGEAESDYVRRCLDRLIWSNKKNIVTIFIMYADLIIS